MKHHSVIYFYNVFKIKFVIVGVVTSNSDSHLIIFWL